MRVHISGLSDTSKKKRCQTCKHFMLWGTIYGHCMKLQEDMSKNDKCKYHKRNAEFWTKDGKAKNELAYYSV